MKNNILSLFIRFFVGVIILVLSSGCLADRSASIGQEETIPPPTLNPFFAEIKEIDLLTSETKSKNNSQTNANSTSKLVDTPSPTENPLVQTSVVVYDEKLNKSWSLEESTGVYYDTLDKASTHNGLYAISYTPTTNFGKLFFSVRQDAEEKYHQKDILGVRFWIYSGEGIIATDDLAVSIIGSNKYPYYVENDNSVQNRYEPIFSETRLYYLDFNRDIPPQTWVEVEVWLDRLNFDPVYKYITGIKIINDSDFRQKVYIDDMELIRIEKQQK